MFVFFSIFTMRVPYFFVFKTPMYVIVQIELNRSRNTLLGFSFNDVTIISLLYYRERSELQAKVKTLNTQMSEELKRKGAIQSKDMANYLVSRSIQIQSYFASVSNILSTISSSHISIRNKIFTEEKRWGRKKRGQKSE